MVNALGQTSQSLSATLDADQLQRAALGCVQWEMLAVAEFWQLLHRPEMSRLACPQQFAGREIAFVLSVTYQSSLGHSSSSHTAALSISRCVC